MSLASRLPFRHAYAAGFPGLGSQPVPTDADALDYLDRMAAADGTSVEVGVATAVDAFFRDARESGVLSSIRSSCVLAGARTLAGALVPLKNEGPELWTAPTPTIANAYGSSGTWDADTQTATSSTATISNTFPRFRFPVAIVAGKDYRITATLVVSDANALTYYRLGYDGAYPLPAAVGNVITLNVTRTAASGFAVFELDFDSTIGPASVTIESLSIREVIASPTNVADGFVEGDYSRTSGLTGDGATTYLDSGRDSADDGQDNHHLAVHQTSPQVGSPKYIAGRGVTNSGTTSLVGVSGATNKLYTRSRNSIDNGGASGLSAVGLLGMSRGDSDNYDVRVNGVTTNTVQDSQETYAGNIYIFLSNGAGTGFAYDGTLSFYSIGTDIGSAGLADLDTAVSNLINRLKFALLVGENPSGLDPDTIDYIVRGYENGGSLE